MKENFSRPPPRSDTTPSSQGTNPKQSWTGDTSVLPRAQISIVQLVPGVERGGAYACAPR